MRPELIDLLRCPECAGALELAGPVTVEGRIREGDLECRTCNQKYPVRNFVPRFVPQTNYADNFGMQWNKFRRTQLDSTTGVPISANRFWKATAWSPADLRGKWVLDVGCGAGRFAEIALSAGAKVIAVDYSSAVDACYANLGNNPNLYVLQADVYRLPLRRAIFPYVYSLGVLQHTPDVRRAFHALPPMMLPDGAGQLCVDFYERSFKSCMQPKYALRPITKRMDKAVLFRILQRSVPTLLKISNGVGHVPAIGALLRRMVPVANYRGIQPLDDRQLAEWAVLDTFDWLAPEYDNPQTRATVQKWLQEAHCQNIEVLKAGHLVGRGRSCGSQQA